MHISLHIYIKRFVQLQLKKYEFSNFYNRYFLFYAHLNFVVNKRIVFPKIIHLRKIYVPLSVYFFIRKFISLLIRIMEVLL